MCLIYADSQAWMDLNSAGWSTVAFQLDVHQTANNAGSDSNGYKAPQSFPPYTEKSFCVKRNAFIQRVNREVQEERPVPLFRLLINWQSMLLLSGVSFSRSVQVKHIVNSAKQPQGLLRFRLTALGSLLLSTFTLISSLLGGRNSQKCFFITHRTYILMLM